MPGTSYMVLWISLKGLMMTGCVFLPPTSHCVFPTRWAITRPQARWWHNTKIYGPKLSILYPSHTGHTDTKPSSLKPTKIIQFGERSVNHRYWFGFVGLVSFMFRQTHLSGRALSNIIERFMPNKLQVVCWLYVGLNLTWHRFRADSRPNQVRHNTKLHGVCRHTPESKPTSAWDISNPNRM